jgi:hypothetical protein
MAGQTYPYPRLPRLPPHFCRLTRLLLLLALTYILLILLLAAIFHRLHRLNLDPFNATHDALFGHHHRRNNDCAATCVTELGQAYCCRYAPAKKVPYRADRGVECGNWGADTGGAVAWMLRFFEGCELGRGLDW